jgi:site-specific recombinase XerD
MPTRRSSFSEQKRGGRLTNKAYGRTREYLTPSEVEDLLKAARASRHGVRDHCMILLAYRHGLRVGELVALQWSQIHLSTALLAVRRLKRGKDSTQRLGGVEMRALRRLKGLKTPSPYVFVSQLGGPLTDRAVRYIVRRAGKLAGIGFPVHPHQLRHACGYKLANDGVDTRRLQDYLGHRNIQHTVRYTELSPDRFKGFWED